MFTRDEASEIKVELQIVSTKILKYYHALLEPTKPVIRQRRWEHCDPDPIPIGMAFHYTGGPSGLKSMKWFNHPGWGNTVSSAHVLIFDHVPDNFIGEAWDAAPDKLKELFPVPTLLLAGWRYGTWCTNWVNKQCFGVENRNVGKNTQYMTTSTEGNFLTVNGKEIVRMLAAVWEPYTREQIICNINLGRVLQAWTGNNLDPDYIFGHSSVWATKSDPGPDFPLHLIRGAIFSPVAIGDLPWLPTFPRAGYGRDNNETWIDFSSDFRDDQQIDHVVFSTDDVDLTVAEEGDLMGEWLTNRLYWLGFNAANPLSDKQLRRFIKWFQKSTDAYKKVNRSSEVLKVDGIFGPKTKRALEVRLWELGYRC